MNRTDEAAITNLTLSASLLTGEVPEKLALLLAEGDQNYRARRAAEKELDASAKELRGLLRRQVRRVLGRGIYIDHLDAGMVVDHSRRPETVAPYFNLSFWLQHKSRRLHHPSVTVTLRPLRGRETVAQLRALRAAADTYQETLAQLLKDKEEIGSTEKE